MFQSSTDIPRQTPDRR